MRTEFYNSKPSLRITSVAVKKFTDLLDAKVISWSSVALPDDKKVVRVQFDIKKFTLRDILDNEWVKNGECVYVQKLDNIEARICQFKKSFQTLSK